MNDKHQADGWAVGRRDFVRRWLVGMPLGTGVVYGSLGHPAWASAIEADAGPHEVRVLVDRAGELMKRSVSSLAVDSERGERTVGLRFADLANVKDHGAAGAGDADESAALHAALASANSDVVYFPKGTYRIEADVQVGAEKILVFQPEARLEIVEGATLTVLGHVEAGSDEIFSGAGSIHLRGNSQVNVRWFGARPGEVSSGSLQKCFDSIGDGVSVVFTRSRVEGEAVYKTDRTLYLRGRKHVRLTADRGVRIELTQVRSTFLEAEDCEELCLSGLDCFAQFEPSQRRGDNKVLLARSCRHVRMESCRAEKLALLRARGCEYCELVSNHADGGVDAADYRGHGGLDYGVSLAAAFYSIVRHNVIRNYVVDGVKVTGRRRGPGGSDRRRTDLDYGGEAIIDGNIITGCVNDDAIDLFGSGNKVIITNNLMVDNQKGVNAKQGRDPNAPIHDAIIANNIVIGGRYNEAINSLQTGMNADMKRLIVTGNIIRDVRGQGFMFSQSGSEVIIANCLIENIAHSTDWRWGPERLNGLGIRDGTEADTINVSPSFLPANAEPAPMKRRDGNVSISNCIFRNCEGYGVFLRHSARGGLDSCVFENVGHCAVMVDYFEPQAAPMIIQGCRIGTRDTDARTSEGIRVTANAMGGAIVTNCVIYGQVDKPLIDATEGRKVDHAHNSWNRSAGRTNQRPGSGLRREGTTYFDTDLEKQIVWTGLRWIDATGSSV